MHKVNYNSYTKIKVLPDKLIYIYIGRGVCRYRLLMVGRVL